MREAIIVSTARTGIGKAYRGAFNNTQAPTLGGWAIEAAVKKAGIDPASVDDCFPREVAMQECTQARAKHVAWFWTVCIPC